MPMTQKGITRDKPWWWILFVCEYSICQKDVPSGKDRELTGITTQIYIQLKTIGKSYLNNIYYIKQIQELLIDVNNEIVGILEI